MLAYTRAKGIPQVPRRLVERKRPDRYVWRLVLFIFIAVHVRVFSPWPKLLFSYTPRQTGITRFLSSPVLRPRRLFLSKPDSRSRETPLPSFPLYFHGRVKYVSTELSFSSLSIHKRERLSINFFGGRKEERNIRFRIFPKKILNVKETRRFEFYFFFIKRSGGEKGKTMYFFIRIFLSHVSRIHGKHFQFKKKKRSNPTEKVGWHFSLKI